MYQILKHFSAPAVKNYSRIEKIKAGFPFSKMWEGISLPIIRLRICSKKSHWR